MIDKSRENRPMGEFDENGNFKEPEVNLENKEDKIKVETLEENGGLVEITRHLDEKGRKIYEHKKSFENAKAKEAGQAAWVNDDHFSYDEENRLIYRRKTGYSNEEAFSQGKMTWGQETNFSYEKKGNKVIAETRDLKSEGVWREETIYDTTGRKLKRIGEIIEGEGKGKKWVKEYSYREGEIEHAGQKYKGLIEEEVGQRETPDGQKKSWRKIIVFDEEGNYLTHWRTQE